MLAVRSFGVVAGPCEHDRVLGVYSSSLCDGRRCLGMTGFSKLGASL